MPLLQIQKYEIIRSSGIGIGHLNQVILIYWFVFPPIGRLHDKSELQLLMVKRKLLNTLQKQLTFALKHLEL